MWMHFRLFEVFYEDDTPCKTVMVASGKIERTLKYLMDNFYVVFGNDETYIKSIAKNFDYNKLIPTFKEFISESSLTISERIDIFDATTEEICKAFENSIHEKQYSEELSMKNENGIPQYLKDAPSNMDDDEFKSFCENANMQEDVVIGDMVKYGWSLGRTEYDQNEFIAPDYVY